MLKVFKECCKNCLLTKGRIVSPERASEIVKTCLDNDSYFLCHKGTMNNEDIVCKSYFDKFGDKSRVIQIAKRLELIEFIPQEESEKFITYDEMSKS